MRGAAIATALLLSGCAALSSPSATLLARVDQRMVAEDYRGALALYDEFLQAYPGDAAAARARAVRTALDRLLASQAETERLQRDLATRDSDLIRLRRDLSARQSEVERLRADLERLRSIDLRQEQRRR